MKYKVFVERLKETEPGYRLGLVMNKRQEFAQYDWAKVVKLSKTEGSENRIRTEITVYGWGDDGKRDDRFYQRFAGADVKEAIAYAKRVVEDGSLHSAHVSGEATRLFAQRGFGDRAVFGLANVKRAEEVEADARRHESGQNPRVSAPLKRRINRVLGRGRRN